MSIEIPPSKLYAEQTLAYILNKLRNHDQIVKNLLELKGDGWRKMKYARGLFDRRIGFLSANEVNKELIALIEPFHCEVKTCSQLLYDELSGKYQIEHVGEKELFELCDIIVVQGDAEDYKSGLTAEYINSIKNEALLILATDDVAIDEGAIVENLKAERINAVVSDTLSFAKDVAGTVNVLIAKQSIDNK